MKRPSPTSRRLLTLFAAATAAVLAMASPAFACAGDIQGTPTCGTTAGTWQVTWEISNDWTPATISVLEKSSNAPILDVTTKTPIALNTTVPAPRRQGRMQVVLTGVQTLPMTETTATLTIDLHWNVRGQKDLEYSQTVDMPTNCQAAPPPVSPSASPSPSPKKSSPAAHSSSPVTGGGGGGGLPVTGVNTAAIAGVAVALIGGGVVLVLLGRRRRDSTSS